MVGDEIREGPWMGRAGSLQSTRVEAGKPLRKLYSLTQEIEWLRSEEVIKPLALYFLGALTDFTEGLDLKYQKKTEESRMNLRTLA